MPCPWWAPAPTSERGQCPGVAVLDVIYVVVTVAVFAIVALVAKGAERL
ncbi:hypothetical protein [Microbacterium hominis]|nr:hypothetical protein [Microbacterium hominis]